MWFGCAKSRVMKALVSGAAKGGVERPCTPDDIYNIVKRLLKKGDLSRKQTRLMFFHALNQTFPHAPRMIRRNGTGDWESAMTTP